jgi:hypothetical protein
MVFKGLHLLQCCSVTMFAVFAILKKDLFKGTLQTLQTLEHCEHLVKKTASKNRSRLSVSKGKQSLTDVPTALRFSVGSLKR